MINPLFGKSPKSPLTQQDRARAGRLNYSLDDPQAKDGKKDVAKRIRQVMGRVRYPANKIAAEMYWGKVDGANIGMRIQTRAGNSSSGSFYLFPLAGLWARNAAKSIERLFEDIREVR